MKQFEHRLFLIQGSSFNSSTDSLEKIRDEITVVEGATFSASTDSLEKIRDEITAVEGAGFATGSHSLKLIKDAVDAISTAHTPVDTAGTHDVTTVNDKTETQVFEIARTNMYRLDVYFDLNALVAAGEGDLVTIKMYNKIDETNYRQVAEVEFLVGTTNSHPTLNAITINHNTRFTIQCSNDVSATRTINYRYIITPLE